MKNKNIEFCLIISYFLIIAGWFTYNYYFGYWTIPKNDAPLQVQYREMFLLIARCMIATSPALYFMARSAGYESAENVLFYSFLMVCCGLGLGCMTGMFSSSY